MYIFLNDKSQLQLGRWLLVSAKRKTGDEPFFFTLSLLLFPGLALSRISRETTHCTLRAALVSDHQLPHTVATGQSSKYKYNAFRKNSVPFPFSTISFYVTALF
jgi:hypothetical protein